MDPDRPPAVTVVIPTLDEERCVEACIASVAGDDVQVVVSDGGSSDRTCERASAWPGVEVVTGPAGRGPQLNLGAARSRAPILLFLHADCQVPQGWRHALERGLADPHTTLCCFWLHTEPVGQASRLGRAWLRLVDLRSRGNGLPYGDQGFGLRRAVFEQLGGFRAIPLMEDLELAARCRKLGAVERLPLLVRTSARRFERYPVRTRLMTASFPLLFHLGVSPDWLARWYTAVR